MKSRILFSIVFASLLISCKKETPAPVSATKELIPVVEKVKSDCYEVNKSGNVISLQINYNNDKVSGTLSYALQEKDKNTGTFEGIIKDSIIIADYTFQSEGIKSVRQIAFKLKGNQALEGYGDMNDQGTKFKDISQLNFEGRMPMNRVDCSN